MKVEQLVNKHYLKFRTGTDQRIIEVNKQQEVVGWFVLRTIPQSASPFGEMKKFVAFVFFDVDGHPRGYVDGWQDTQNALKIIEFAYVDKGKAKDFLKMRLLFDL